MIRLLSNTRNQTSCLTDFARQEQLCTYIQVERRFVGRFVGIHGKIKSWIWIYILRSGHFPQATHPLKYGGCLLGTKWREFKVGVHAGGESSLPVAKTRAHRLRRDREECAIKSCAREPQLVQYGRREAEGEGGREKKPTKAAAVTSTSTYRGREGCVRAEGASYPVKLYNAFRSVDDCSNGFALESSFVLRCLFISCVCAGQRQNGRDPCDSDVPDMNVLLLLIITMFASWIHGTRRLHFGSR